MGGWNLPRTREPPRGIPRKLTFTDPESRQMLELAVETGRGGVHLRLTPEQYRALRRP